MNSNSPGERLLQWVLRQRVRSQGPIWRYGQAVLIVVVVTVLRRELVPWLGIVAPYNLMVCGVVVAWVLLGTGPGLVAVVLGFLSVEVFVLGSVSMMFDGATLVRLGLSVAIGILVVWLFHAFEAARARLEALVAATYEGVVESESGRIVDCNEQFARMVGRTVPELKGTPIAELIPPEERERVVATIAANRESAIENTLLGADGKRLIVEARGRRLFPRSERRHTVVRDITERKAFQTELERLVAQRTGELLEMVGELEHLSYSMVHNMRAPLRGIAGFASLLACREGERLSPESQDLLCKLQGSVAQMDMLINHVLNYNKAVRSSLPVEQVEPARLLRELIETYSEFSPPQAEILLEGEFPPVLANVVGLSQCLAELLRNGVKFVPPGTLPRIKVWAERGGNPGNWLRLWVEDNGVGIRKEWQSRVFNLFERECGPEYPGTGVGLALVRKLVERMGGRVGVESEFGKGSRFWLELREPVK